MTLSYNDQPIGVFDSGVGGLTVLKALKEQLPKESFIYLGDTARLPYGTKSEQTVIQYAMQAAEILVSYGVKMLVIACNTATAIALDALKKNFIEIPVLGVINPGAQAACRHYRGNDIIVLATEATVAHGAYETAIKELCPQANVISRSAQLLVALAEEGWVQGDIPEAVIKRYLEGLLESPTLADCLVLGCTHFPALYDALRAVVPSQVSIVDSASTTAHLVAQQLIAKQLCANNSQPSTRFLVTDAAARFARIAINFLGAGIDPNKIELVDIQACRLKERGSF